MASTHIPDLVPVLSPGKHRNARKGACFMEFASFLAGERWSDQPRCTHELLAGLARLINDNVSDQMRSRLVELIPRVVGLNSHDVRIHPVLSIRAAAVAMPIAPRAHQRALAVGMLAAERFLLETDETVPPRVRSMIDTATQDAPDAFAWAHGFRRAGVGSSKLFARRAAPRIVLNAVDGIIRSNHRDADQMLHDLLEAAIVDCEMIRDATAAATATAPETAAAALSPVSLAPTS